MWLVPSPKLVMTTTGYWDNFYWRGICLLVCLPSRPIDVIWAVMIVWRIRGNLIRTVQCCIVYTVVSTHMWKLLQTGVLGLVRFRFGWGIFVCFCIFLTQCQFVYFVFLAYFLLPVLCCQYQCKWLPGIGKARLPSPEMTYYASSGT